MRLTTGVKKFVTVNCVSKFRQVKGVRVHIVFHLCETRFLVIQRIPIQSSHHLHEL